MIYASTRGEAPKASFETILTRALASDGGLYVPERLPALPTSLAQKPYEEIAAEILRLFAGDWGRDKDFSALARESYAPFRHHPPPLEETEEGVYLLELFHGPSGAFKDYAMRILSRLMELVLTESGGRMTILTATSGDTGAAAMSAFAESRLIHLAVLYPKGRVSPVQERQMTSLAAPHLHALAIEGDFDDCQAIVKQLMSDEALAERLNLSGVNSINWARIAAQIAYYVYAAGIVPDADFAVPTGNFGDILAGYAAKRMGAPLGRLVIAANENAVLPRAFETGLYAPRAARASLAPSMDIQAPSNFERALFDAMGRDSEKLRLFFKELEEKKQAAIPKEALAFLRRHFAAEEIKEEESLRAIASLYQKKGYMMDPHTAIGYAAAKRRKRDGAPIIALATAHAAKFPDAVRRAIGKEADSLALPAPFAAAKKMGLKETPTSLAPRASLVRAYLLREMDCAA